LIALSDVGVQVVEDDQIDTTFDVIVGLHVGFDGGRSKQGAFSAFDRDIHESERRHVLPLAVFEQLEVVFRQVRDRHPL
jgi:hypothetical protein